MSLLVQDYLTTHTFAQLFAEHGVEASFHSMGYKCSLNYSQLDAKDDNVLAQECRGLILATNDGRSLNHDAEIINGRFNFDEVCPGQTIVLCHGFDRFFNHGQGAAAEIDWSDPHLSIANKIDGTLIQCYLDTVSRQWCAATRSVPEADLPGNDGRTFRQLFEKALMDHLKLTWEEFISQLDPNLTYCFELVSPYNMIVVRHDACRIYFLGARDLRTQHEVPTNDQRFDCWPRPQHYSLSNLNEVIEYVNAQDATKQEGVVVKGSKSDARGSFPRIKIKSPQYVLASKARDTLGTSNRNCLELILTEKEDDLIPILPTEIVANLMAIKEGYAGWLKNQEADYRAIAEEAAAIDGTKKTFALIVKKHNISYPPAYFAIYDGKARDFKDFVLSARKEGVWSNSFLDRLLEEIRRPVRLPVEVRNALEEVKQMLTA